jgi:uncharacterized membrane protein
VVVGAVLAVSSLLGSAVLVVTTAAFVVCTSVARRSAVGRVEVV